ncbi:hypothetical protein HZS_5307 [Henneguya salminicola]|nr:hypothetical protein HZS_5307 [Henneguya salminicola]
MRIIFKRVVNILTNLAHDDIVDFTDKRRKFSSVDILYEAINSILPVNQIISYAKSLIGPTQWPNSYFNIYVYDHRSRVW